MDALELTMLLAAVTGNIEKLDWLSGAWAERKTDGVWTEEYWTPPLGGLMLGAGLSGRGRELRNFEQMRIETGADGAILFVAMPGGGTPVRFGMVKQTADEVVFENAAHDYPQRISYRRERAMVIATASLIDGSRETRWVYRQAD